MKLNLATYNGRGLANSKKRREVFHYLNSKDYNIIFMQETHTIPANENVWRSEWGGSIYYAHGTSNARGAAILIKKSASIKVSKSISDPNGRYVILKCKINNEPYVLADIYGPNVDNQQFYHDLLEKIDELNIDRKIIGGDFNLI